MDKPFSTKFKIDSQRIALIYICYKYKFPLCFMLSFYELYKEHSLFALKALSCVKKIPINDTNFMKLIEESRILYKQILTGISLKIRIEKLKKQTSPFIDKLSLKEPSLNLSVFSEDFKNFIENYLLPNVEEIFSEHFILKMDTNDLYKELTP